MNAYDILTWISLSTAYPLSLFSPKIKHYFTHRLGSTLRKDWPPIFKTRPIWFHALSVGEVRSVVPLVKKWHQRHPEIPLFFTASTQTGHQVASKALKDICQGISYFPLDLKVVIERYLKRLNPRLIVITETDIWPNFLSSTHKKGIPCLLINARMSEASYKRYSLIRPFFAQIINLLDFVGTQRHEDQIRFLNLGIKKKKVEFIGNLKFDIPLPSSLENYQDLKKKLGIKPNRLVWIAGSTHRGEHEIILKVHQALLKIFPDLLLIIAPRHPERFESTFYLSQKMGFKTVRRSQQQATDAQVMILDTIGELADLYAICDLAFIGGSLVPIGGHNPLEAARFAKPVIWGPYMFNFSEIASELINHKAGFNVNNARQLFEIIQVLLKERPLRELAGKHAQAILRQNQGITEKYISIIESNLNRSE